MDVLLAEDNRDHAELVMRGFLGSSSPHRIQWVSDGEQTLDYLLARGKYADTGKYPRPELILLDLKMPRMSGHEVLKAIKADSQLRNIPVVVLTTSDADVDIRQAYEENVNSYLVKPIDYPELVRLLQNVEAYWAKWNRLPKG